MKTKNHVIIYCLIISVFIISGCATTRIVNLPKPSDEGVEVYMTQMPDKAYNEIKYIQVDGAIFHTPERLMIDLSEKAKVEGADAVINVKFDYQAWYPVLSGVAIKYK
ncbi:MAG: hypothetical protein PHH30_04890 [Bacteroidales bacterium]|nr:hypothetical protein [Bacteroidales bacterium]